MITKAINKKSIAFVVLLKSGSLVLDSIMNISNFTHPK